MAEREGYFLVSQHDSRVRRARDAVRVGAGVLVLLVAASNSIRLSSLQAAMTSVVDVLPGWSQGIFWVGYAVAGIYALVMIVVVIGRVRQDPGAARDVVLSAVLALVIAVIAMRWREGAWPRLAPEFATEDPEQLFPMIRVAVVTATVLALSPHVTRAVRRLGTIMIALVMLFGFGLEFGYPSDAIGAVAIGMVASGAVLLVFGCPGGYPDPSIVSAALRQLGVEVTGLELASDQSWGTRRLIGRDGGGSAIEVKAYGRDAADTQLASKAWRSLWYRDTGPDVAYTRMQAVEHEALMMMFAERAGVNAVEPLTAGMAGDDVAIIAFRRPGRPLAELAPEEVTDETVVGAWREVAALHDTDMSHGALTGSAVLIENGDHVLTDFSQASLAAGERCQADIVSLLFSLGSLIGTD